MRTPIAALVTVCALAGCGSPYAASTPQPTPSAPAAAASTPPPASVHPCAAAADLVAPYRVRAGAAWVDHAGNAAAMRRALRALAKDAGATYESVQWRQAIDTCQAQNSGDHVSRGDVAELRMWNVDVALASLGLANGDDPDKVMSDLTTKLTKATTLTN